MRDSGIEEKKRNSGIEDGVLFTCMASPVQVLRGGRMVWRGTGSSVCTRNETNRAS